MEITKPVNGLPSVLLELEAKIYSPGPVGKTGVLIRFLQKWTTNRHLQEWNTHAPDQLVQIFYSRLASCIVHLFLDENTSVSKEQYVLLLPYGPLIGHVFFLSGFQNAAFLTASLRKRSQTGHQQHLAFSNRSDLQKFLLSIHPFSSADTHDLIALADHNPGSLLPVLLNFLTTRITVFPDIIHNKNKVSDLLANCQGASLSEQSISAIFLLWAQSSYDDEASNRKIKQQLNRLLESYILTTGLSLTPTTSLVRFDQLTLSTKPRLLIAAEVMKHEHVMFRCYGLPLSALRTHFYVIVFTGKQDLGKHPWDWCDELETFDRDAFSLSIEVDRIQKMAPDVIIYPSIGMQKWTLLLSRIRLAPLQISLMGHPDYSYSPRIDLSIIGKDLFHPEAISSTRLIPLKNTPGSLFTFQFESKRPKPQIRKTPPILRIAVCANIFKLTAGFLTTCRSILDQANRPVAFYFMQNLSGLFYQLGKKQILAHLPASHVTVYSAQSIVRYYEILAGCDLYLSPFPFGGENSTLDALLMGLPVVTKTGIEPRTRLDLRVLQGLDLPPWLQSTTNEGYVQTALKLLHDDELRVSISSQIIEKNPRQYFEKEAREMGSELAEKIYEIYTRLDE
ncbi:MAG: hypothetical protein OEY56_04355 [Cyclobacteriaceae bacterium]|nr:hypothetical protein [Cyclobacteriaceae bacterium]